MYGAKQHTLLVLDLNSCASKKNLKVGPIGVPLTCWRAVCSQSLLAHGYLEAKKIYCANKTTKTCSKVNGAVCFLPKCNLYSKTQLILSFVNIAFDKVVFVHACVFLLRAACSTPAEWSERFHITVKQHDICKLLAVLEKQQEIRQPLSACLLSANEANSF